MLTVFCEASTSSTWSPDWLEGIGVWIQGLIAPAPNHQAITKMTAARIPITKTKKQDEELISFFRHVDQTLMFMPQMDGRGFGEM